MASEKSECETSHPKVHLPTKAVELFSFNEYFKAACSLAPYRYCTFFLLPVVGIVRRRARRRIPQFGRIIYCLEKASTAPLASSLAPTHSSNEKCGKLLSLISGNRTARLPFLHPVFIPPYFDNTYFIFTRTCSAQTERQKGSELRRYTDRGKVVARNGKKRMSCGRKGGHNMRGQPAIY